MKPKNGRKWQKRNMNRDAVIKAISQQLINFLIDWLVDSYQRWWITGSRVHMRHQDWCPSSKWLTILVFTFCNPFIIIAVQTGHNYSKTFFSFLVSSIYKAWRSSNFYDFTAFFGHFCSDYDWLKVEVK